MKSLVRQVGGDGRAGVSGVAIHSIAAYLCARGGNTRQMVCSSDKPFAIFFDAIWSTIGRISGATCFPSVCHSCLPARPLLRSVASTVEEGFAGGLPMFLLKPPPCCCCWLVSQRRHAPVSASNTPQIIWTLLVRGHSRITMELTVWSTAVRTHTPTYPQRNILDGCCTS
jgi:hypothetical protein